MDTITQKAHDFFTSRHTGTLATCGEDSTPHVRTMYYAPGDNFSLYFLTLANTRKVADMGVNPKVAFIIADEALPGMLQVEGRVEDLTETALDDKHTHQILDILFEKGERFSPVSRMDAAVIRFYKLTPTWVRFGDFSVGQGTSDVLHDIPV